jgi:hypothetical protein
MASLADNYINIYIFKKINGISGDILIAAID